MSLLSLLISGSSALLSLINQYFSNPVVAGVSIESEVYELDLDADVSERLIIDVNQGKQFLSDNVAPRPRVWQLNGYIAPTLLEISSLSPILQPTLKFQQNQLETAFYSRQLVTFQTKNNEASYLVGIKNLRFKTVPEITNRIPVEMTLKEVNVQFSQTTSGQEGIPTGFGNASADATAAGQTAATKVNISEYAIQSGLLPPGTVPR